MIKLIKKICALTSLKLINNNIIYYLHNVKEKNIINRQK